jgi:hypothetical protein
MELPLILCGTNSTNDRAGFDRPVILKLLHSILLGLALDS